MSFAKKRLWILYVLSQVTKSTSIEELTSKTKQYTLTLFEIYILDICNKLALYNDQMSHAYILVHDILIC